MHGTAREKGPPRHPTTPGQTDHVSPSLALPTPGVPFDRFPSRKTLPVGHLKILVKQGIGLSRALFASANLPQARTIFRIHDRLQHHFGISILPA